MGKIYFLDVTNRDGVQTAKLGLSKIEKTLINVYLNDMGIFHYWQLAELDHDTAHQIGEEVGLPGRADTWVAQAKALTAEAE